MVMSIPEVQIPLGQLGSTAKTSIHSKSILPLLGFGTATWPFCESEEIMKASILTAIKLGYRHFDTASVYQSEKCLGEAISQALKLGLIESRSELFVTSKLWCCDVHPCRVLPALQNTLQFLGSYELPLDKSDLVPMDLKSVWEAMEECHKLGLTKNIGVSNFSIKKLQQLLLTAKIPPAVHQVELSPLWQQKNVRKFCEEKGIHVTAYSPLGAKGTPWGTGQIMECEILKEIAKAKGKTLAQVCLRWVHEQGVSLLVRSFNENRMRENLDIFSWKLNSEECQKIDQLPQRKAFTNLLRSFGMEK